MCMYSTRQHPLVAKNDIVCVKYLRKCPNGVLITPCRDVQPPINKSFVPEYSNAEFIERFLTYEMNGGVIHAQTHNVEGRWGENCIAFEAIIPKGTEYWVDVRGDAIAAKKMIITDKEINITKPHESLLKDILSNTASLDVSVGDFYIKDKGFISPLEMTEEYKKQVAGIVVGFNGTKPLIWSGEVNEYLALDRQCDSKFDKFISSDEIKDDMSGEKHMEAFLKKYGETFDKDRFEVYAKCVDYKPEIGKWYLPAFGEMAEFVHNLMFVHAAAWLADIPMFLSVGWYWTSSEGTSGGCWCLGLYGGDAYYGWDYRGDRRSSCFFLASTNDLSKAKINCLTAEKEDKSFIKRVVKAVKKHVKRRKA